MLPAYIENCAKVTVVVAPLVALAIDIQRRCQEHGLCALPWPQVKEKTFLNGSPSSNRNEPSLHILIVSIESVCTSDFQTYMRRLSANGQVARVVVDEAHITAMAAGYRPKMADLGHALIFFGEPIPRVLLSATIKPQWEEAVASIHGFTEFKCLRVPTVRENIAYKVCRLRAIPFISLYDRYTGQIFEYIQELHEEERSVKRDLNVSPTAEKPLQIVVYAPFTNIVDQIAEKLQRQFDQHGLRQPSACHASQTLVLKYHSKLSDEQKNEYYKKWISCDQFQIVIMVSTGAFGTGIDSPHIRMVFHIIRLYNLLDYI